MKLNRRKLILGGSAVLCAPPRIMFAGTQTGTELDLLFDCSGSMYDRAVNIGGTGYFHAQVQLYGHVNALRAPYIRTLLVRQKVFLRLIGWATGTPRILGDGTAVDDEAIDLFISVMEQNTPKERFFPDGTVHSTGVEFVLDQERVGDRRVIDLITNERIEGSSLELLCKEARARAERSHTTINVMTIGLNGFDATTLSAYIKTADGFLMQETGWDKFPKAIMKKIPLDLIG